MKLEIVFHAFTTIQMVVFAFAGIELVALTAGETENPDTSPFVQVFSVVGIVAAASIVNFVVLTSASPPTSNASAILNTSVADAFLIY